MTISHHHGTYRGNPGPDWETKGAANDQRRIEKIKRYLVTPTTKVDTRISSPQLSVVGYSEEMDDNFPKELQISNGDEYAWYVRSPWGYAE